MENDFYYQFEEKFRGDRETILEKLQAYKPFLEGVSEVYPAGNCVDLGCGRGEWLELLGKYEFAAVGVDSDKAMIEACTAHELNVTHADAISAANLLESDSQAIISGFHIAEHLEFESLQELVKQAQRALLPGGIFILETPNPENLSVASLTFNLDPTHKKPIPPLLLQFLIDYSGFERSMVMRLNHDPNIVSQKPLAIANVLAGASPDYAVIAQKKGDLGAMRALKSAFLISSGITTTALATKYEDDLATQLASMHSVIESIQQSSDASQQLAKTAEERSLSAENKARSAEERAISAEERARHAADLAISSETSLIAIRQSLSWKITAPLRFLMDIFLIKPVSSVRTMLNTAVATAIDVLGKPLSHAMAFAAARPTIFGFFSRIISTFPHLRNHLNRTYAKHQKTSGLPTAQQDLQFAASDYDEMNRVAKEIFVDLQTRKNEKRTPE